MRKFDPVPEVSKLHEKASDLIDELAKIPEMYKHDSSYAMAELGLIDVIEALAQLEFHAASVRKEYDEWNEGVCSSHESPASYGDKHGGDAPESKL